MTAAEWARCVLILRSVYKFSFKLDDTDMDVWFALLMDLPGPDVLAAVIHMAGVTPAFPSVAEIKKYAEQRTGSVQAWEEVMRGVRTHGYYAVPEWSDERIKRAVEYVGGWQTICKSQLDELPYLQNRFEKAFATHDEAAQLEAVKHRLGVLPTLGAPLALEPGTQHIKQITGGKQ